MIRAEEPTNLSIAKFYNYFDSAEFDFPEVRGEVEMPSLFETVPDGILVRANRPRGGGTLITKQPYCLAGWTIDLTWSGSGGSSFMQPVCGANTEPWPTDLGNDEAYYVICTYGNSWAGSWVAEPETKYKTQINFSNGSYTAKTYILETGQLRGEQSADFDFTKPRYFYFRTGDTFDFTNAYLKVHSLVMRPPTAERLYHVRIVFEDAPPVLFKEEFIDIVHVRTPFICFQDSAESNIPVALDAVLSDRDFVVATATGIFARSHVYNVRFSHGEPIDKAFNIYMVDYAELLKEFPSAPAGLAENYYRFNSAKQGYAYMAWDALLNKDGVLVEMTNQQRAIGIAHELGHLVGLHHLDLDSDVSTFFEVMDGRGILVNHPTTNGRFSNEIIRISGSPITTNTQYHLRRFLVLLC